MKSTIEGRFPPSRSGIRVLSASSIGACGRAELRFDQGPGIISRRSPEIMSCGPYRGLRWHFTRACKTEPSRPFLGRSPPGPRVADAATEVRRCHGSRQRQVTFHVKRTGRSGEDQLLPSCPGPKVSRGARDEGSRQPRPEAAHHGPRPPTTARGRPPRPGAAHHGPGPPPTARGRPPRPEAAPHRHPQTPALADPCPSRAHRQRGATHSGIWPLARPGCAVSSVPAPYRAGRDHVRCLDSEVVGILGSADLGATPGWFGGRGRTEERPS